MINLAVQQLRRRAFRYFALFFAIFASVALTVAASAITSSLVGSVDKLFAQPYSNVDSVITLSSTTTEEAAAITEQIAALPDAQNVAFDQSFYASIRESDGIYAGISVQAIAPGELQWRDITAGRLPENAHEVAAPSGTELGQKTALRIPGIEADFEVVVVGTVKKSAQEILTGANLLFATPATLSAWNPTNAQGEIRVQGVQPSELEAMLIDAPINITTATAQIDSLAENYLGQRDRYFLLLSAFVLVAAVVAFLVVFSAYLVLTGERSREFGLIRAVGASTGQILGSVFVESALLGICAAALGAPAGLWSARLLAGEAHRFGIKVPLDDVSIASTTLWIIAVAGVIMSILAALPAAFTVTRTPALIALRSTAVSPSHRWISIAWLVLAAGLCGLARWLQNGSSVLPNNSVLAAIGIAGTYILGLLIMSAVLIPLFLHGLSRFVGPVPTLQLGWAYAAKQKARAGALVAVIVAGAALSSAVLHGQTLVRDHLLSAAANTGGPDLVINSLDSDIPAEMLGSIVNVPGVMTADAPASVPVEFPSGGSTTALLIDPAINAELTREPENRAIDGTISLARTSALAAQYTDGSGVEVELGNSRISAIIHHSNNPYTSIDPALVADIPLPMRTIIVRLDGPAIQPADNSTTASVRTTIASFEGRYSVSESFSARNDTLSMVNRITTLSTLLAIIAMVIAAFGLINTVSLTIAERSRDRELLRTIGITPPGHISVMSVEMASLSLPTALIGAVSGGVLGHFVAGVVTGSSTEIMELGNLHIPTLVGILLAMMLGAVLCGMIALTARDHSAKPTTILPYRRK